MGKKFVVISIILFVSFSQCFCCILSMLFSTAVLCSKKRFAEKEAEGWWNQNKERVFNKYNYRGHGAVTLPTNAASNDEEYATSSPFT